MMMEKQENHLLVPDLLMVGIVKTRTMSSEKMVTSLM